MRKKYNQSKSLVIKRIWLIVPMTSLSFSTKLDVSGNLFEPDCDHLVPSSKIMRRKEKKTLNSISIE